MTGARSPEDEPRDSESTSEPVDPVVEAAARVGGVLGRLARQARRAIEGQQPAVEQALRDSGEGLRRASEAAKPELERLARQAKAAAEAAAPHIEQAARKARSYVEEHEPELRKATSEVAGEAARAKTPRAFRPAVDAFVENLRPRPRKSAPEPEAEPPGSP